MSRSAAVPPQRPPPPTTKAQVGAADSCTSLPLWLTQLGFSSFIFLLDPFASLFPSFPRIQRGPMSPPPSPPRPAAFGSNSVRHFVVLEVQLHFRGSSLSPLPAESPNPRAPRAQVARQAAESPDDESGDTGAVGKCFRCF